MSRRKHLIRTLTPLIYANITDPCIYLSVDYYPAPQEAVLFLLRHSELDVTFINSDISQLDMKDDRIAEQYRNWRDHYLKRSSLTICWLKDYSDLDTLNSFRRALKHDPSSVIAVLPFAQQGTSRGTIESIILQNFRKEYPACKVVMDFKDLDCTVQEWHKSWIKRFGEIR